MKILLTDIETSPNVVHVWSLWNQNVSKDQVIKPSHLLCWCAKWLGSDEILFDSIHQSPVKKVLKGIHSLLDEADIVIGYNSSQFDIPVLHREFVLHEMKPPAPFQQVDLLSTVKRQFNFPSNSLAYVSGALGLGGKVQHEGHMLWVKCMNGDEQAWKKMEEYNVGDVLLLEKLYERIKGWVKHHPNRGLYVDANKVCPVCESTKLQHRGFRITKVHKFQRFQCKGCGGWSSSRIAEPKEAKVIV